MFVDTRAFFYHIKILGCLVQLSDILDFYSALLVSSQIYNLRACSIFFPCQLLCTCCILWQVCTFLCFFF
ncbi:hypothetical protein CW304_21380 [Bacillus sp. UFRGS-B20]|nr:hypothetical protein CW304_21380 [Bacillus sp. UFRGS-B20]